MGSGAAGQPMNSDNTSWPFTSPAGKDAKDASKPHEIDLYIEPSPRDSPTTLPTPEAETSPEASGATSARDAPPPRPRAEAAPARTVEFYQATPGVADVEFFVEEDDAPAVHEPMTYDEVMRRRRPPPAPASMASDLVPEWLSNYWS